MIKRFGLLLLLIAAVAWGQGAPGTIYSTPNAATVGCCTAPNEVLIVVRYQVNGVDAPFPGGAPLGLEFWGPYATSGISLSMTVAPDNTYIMGQVPSSELAWGGPATILVTLANESTVSTTFEINWPPYVSSDVVGFAPGVPFSEQLTATGGTGELTWSWPPPPYTPPAGFNLTAQGILSGTIAGDQPTTVDVMVMDSFNVSTVGTIYLEPEPVIDRITPGGVTQYCCDGSRGLIIDGARLTPEDGDVYYLDVMWGSGTGQPSGSLTVEEGSTTTRLLVSGFPDDLPVGTYWIQVGYWLGEAGYLTSDRFPFPVNPPIGAVGPSPIAVTAGVPFSRQLTVSGGTPPYTFDGGPGSGLTVSSSGVLSGTIPTPQSVMVMIGVSDASGAVIVGANVTVIASASTLALATTFPAATVGQLYWQELRATGGVPPYNFTVSGLPPGLQTQNGAVAGTPTQAGTFTVTVSVTDSQKQTDSGRLTLEVKPASFAILNIALQNAMIGRQYSEKLLAANGVEPYTWSLDGALPPGLTLDPGTGAISGTPTKSGLYRFTARATDAKQVTVSKTLTILVVAPALYVTTVSVPSGAIETPYSTTLAAEGGEPPYTWSVSAGSLPPGLTLESTTGVISGEPSTAGTYRFTAAATDAGGQKAIRAFEIVVADLPPLRIETASAGSPTIGTDHSVDLKASGGTPPYTWSLASGALPDGIRLDAANARLTGKAEKPGTYTFTIRVTDSSGATATRDYTVVVPVAPVTVNFDVSGAGAGRQGNVTAGVVGPYPTAMTGRVTMTFTPEAGLPDDPAVQFATGGRTADFSVPPGAQAAMPFQSGTVAGTITFRATVNAGGVDVTPSPAPEQTVRIQRAAPVISSGSARRTTGGLEVTVNGFATGREITSATFRFTSGAGSTLQTSEFTVQVGQAFTSWFSSAASNQYGSQFTYTQPFTVQGDTSGVVSVTVTLSNSLGPSGSITLNF